MSFLTRALGPFYRKKVEKQADAVKIGILGAANIAPNAIIRPAAICDSVEIVGVAARNKQKATEFASKHGIPVVYDSYDAMLADSQLDAIYIPLPNGLHCEWAIKALRAGKHVLLEKPLTSNLAEARALADEARKSNKVLMEAFHYRYHPFIQRLKQIIESGEIGNVREITAKLLMGKGIAWLAFGKDDIRYNFELAGGIMMDAGCYPTSAVRYLSGSEPAEVLQASPTGLASEKVETGMSAQFRMENGIIANITADFNNSLFTLFDSPITIIGDKGKIEASGFVAPHVLNKIVTTSNDKTTTESVYADGRMSYDFQLQAFIDGIKGNRAAILTDAPHGVQNMRAIDMVYEKSGLPIRPSSWLPK